MDDSVVRKLDEIHIRTEYTPEEDDQTETSIQQQSYVSVLTEEEIRSRMENEIQIFSDIYSIPGDEATLLLPQFRRSVSDFNKKWFCDVKSVRESVGLLERPPHDSSSDDKEFYCGVCSESHPLENSASVSCGHRVCTCCWTSIICNFTESINNIINESSAAEWNMQLKCPYLSCQASVGRDMIDRFASEEDKLSYDRYLLRSYVEDTKTMKWCPAPGCGCAIERSPHSENFDVTCLCSLRFCWNCREDVHSPVECKSAANWLALEMNIYDNQNPNWVLENTVACPECNRRVQQNQDYSLKMICLPPCNYHFCWLCRGGEGTGCNLYTCYLDAVLYAATDQERKQAEVAAYKYRDCYENWKSNELLMQKANAKLQKLDTIIQYLSSTQLATVPQLKFIKEAGRQIVECRRVLKWTYAYEYYLREDEIDKQALLKHNQVVAEIPLKKLYHYAEYKLQMFLDAEGPSEKFTKFSIKLTRLTSITRDHYEGLVRELTNVVPA